MTKIYGWLAGALILLSGCSTSPSPLPIPQATLQGQVTQMRAIGIQMIQQGDRLMLIIPTDVYFEPGTATVKESQQQNLRQMALCTKKFADAFPNSIIRVIGYTDQVLNQKTQLVLSQSYAEAVSAYLFNAGVDRRRIATEGRGSREPVAEQAAPRSATLNRRVVVQVN
jgi:outer membrane protein OmpA-like peptidoglycan-associated protein